MFNFILGFLTMYILAGITIGIMDYTENEKINTVFMWMYFWWALLLLIICVMIEAIINISIKRIRRRGKDAGSI